MLVGMHVCTFVRVYTRYIHIHVHILTQWYVLYTYVYKLYTCYVQCLCKVQYTIAGPLVRIKQALTRVQAENTEMDLRIGVVRTYARTYICELTFMLYMTVMGNTYEHTARLRCNLTRCHFKTSNFVQSI